MNFIFGDGTHDKELENRFSVVIDQFLHDYCGHGALVSLLCFWRSRSAYPHITDGKADTQKWKMTIAPKAIIRFKCLIFFLRVLPSPFPEEFMANLLHSSCSPLGKINFLRQWQWSISLH